MDRSTYDSRLDRHLAMVAARMDRLSAPSASSETLPEWRRKAAEQVRSRGFVAVWATSDMAPVL